MEKLMPHGTNVRPLTVDGSLQICRIIWVAFLFTQGAFFGLTLLAPSKVTEPADPVVTWIMLAVAMMIVSVSYVVKAAFLKQAAAKQELPLAQTAFMVALAICEGAGILGLLSHFVFGSAFAGLFFVVAVGGILGHFPRRGTFEAVAPPKPIV
jgi:hypothetical protein